MISLIDIMIPIPSEPLYQNAFPNCLQFELFVEEKVSSLSRSLTKHL